MHSRNRETTISYWGRAAICLKNSRRLVGESWWSRRRWQCGVCWLVEIEGSGETAFLVQTLEGLRRIQSVSELSRALERVGAPVVFPFEDWPGSSARVGGVNDAAWRPTTIRRFIESIPTSTNVTRVDTDAGEGFLKPLGNPEGPQVLACDLVGTLLAEWLGLPTLCHRPKQAN